MKTDVIKGIYVVCMGLCAAMLFTLGVAYEYKLLLLPGVILVTIGAIINNKTEV